MTSPSRVYFRFWYLVPLLSFGFLLWVNHGRLQRVEWINGLTGTSATVDAKSATGYAGGIRQLIVPGYNKESYQWIAQTQQMIAEGKWRVRHADYDNAPLGREVRSPSPYRWWLALIAWGDQQWSGRSIGLAVEKAASWADPLLHYLLLVGAVVFTAKRLGAWPAVMLSLGMATLFPFVGSYLPATPGDSGLTIAFVLWSVLPLLAAASNHEVSAPQLRRWFLFAGIMGGCGLWTNVGAQIPILLGIGLGGIGAALLARRHIAVAINASLPWRTWAISGSVTTVILFLVENAPDRLTIGVSGLGEIHPLYALAWLGGGELLHCGCGWLQRSPPENRRGNKVLVTLALLAVLSVPALMLLKGNRAFLTKATYADQLTALAGNIEAENSAAWLGRDGVSLAFLATALPLLLLIPAGWQLWRRRKNLRRTGMIALMLGPVAVAFVFACWQLSWWSLLDAMLLVLLLALVSDDKESPGTTESRVLWIGGFFLLVSPGMYLALPAKEATGAPAALTKSEWESLAERDLAHWLAKRTGPDGAIALAPPNMTTSLFFHGGLRGLGTPYQENQDGFGAAVRIAGASSADEAQALVRQRKLTHIIMPSWDDYLDIYAKLGTNNPEQSLMGLLHTWLPPRWLRPVAYQMPPRKGTEDQFIVIFEVTDLQDNATIISRLAEYFIEMNQVPLATMASKTLGEAYASDLGALVARAQTEIARRDRNKFAGVLEEIITSLGQGTDESLLWDRRVSLSIVLAQGDKIALARTQTAKCFEEMGEYELRGLSTLQLFRFLSLGKVLGLEIKDPALKALAQELLPPQTKPAI